MRRYYLLKRSEFWLAIATLVAVITLDVLPALIIGIVFSLALLIYRASRPQVSVLGVDPDNPATFEDVERHPEATPIPGVLVVRPDAPLFYANVQGIRDAVEADVSGANEAVNAVIFDLDANDEIDITERGTTGEIGRRASRQGRCLRLRSLAQTGRGHGPGHGASGKGRYRPRIPNSGQCRSMGEEPQMKRTASAPRLGPRPALRPPKER